LSIHFWLNLATCVLLLLSCFDVTSNRWRYCKLDDADDIFRMSAQLSKHLRVDVGLANPIKKVTYGGKSDIRIVIATAFALWTYAYDTAKIPNIVFFEAQTAATVSITNT